MCAFLKFCTGAFLVLALALPALTAVLPSADRYVGNNCRLPSGVRGRCTLITDCPAALDAVRRGIRHGNQGNRDRCGFERNIEVVCCDTRSRGLPNPNLVRRPGAPNTVPKPQTEWVRPTRGDKDHNSLSEMKSTIACRKYAKECPKSVRPFITGGKTADNGEFPHMAALGYPISKNGMNISWLCGGTLISERYVMTAAHCSLLSNRKPVVVRLGELDLSTSDDGAEPVDYPIEKVETHPKFVANARYHDLALIRLARPVEFTTTICPACLYTMNNKARAVSASGVENNELTDRILNNGEEIGPRINDEVDLRQRTLLVSGWGSVEHFGDLSPILQKAVIKPFSIEECNDTLTRAAGTPRVSLMPQGINPDAMLCAGDRKGNKDTCQGDSGGPLQFIDTDALLYTVIGITSFGDKCGSSLPAIYTRVSSYVPWIEEKVWG